MTKPYDQIRAFEVASFKSAGKAGEFEALVSVFGNVDRGGDRVMPGAFGKSLARWQEKGDPIPVIWNHMWDNPEAHIGKVLPADAVETDDGLLVKGSLDLDNPFAAQVYRLLSERRVKEFSFGYNLVDAERKNGALELSEIDLFEVGPTLKGMNPATELLAVKALAVATGNDHVALMADGTLRDDRLDGIADWPVVDLTGEPDEPVAAVKAGARYSRETLARLRRMRDELDEMIATGEPPADETPKSDDAKTALGTASDPDADITTELHLLKGLLT
jgi:HK97 family phage prohead protease